MTYFYKSVELIPKELSQGIVYHNEEFELAALLCACGCGHRITLLVPDSHQVVSENGFATIRPSIAVCDGPCRSHYFITAGRVEFLPRFSEAQSTSLMQRQIARHLALDTSKPLTWCTRLRDALDRLIKPIKVLFRRKRQ